MTKNIKVKSTIYPDNQPSIQEWMKEFSIGRSYYDMPNAFGMTFNDHIRYMKEQMVEENRTDIPWQNNFQSKQKQ